MQLPFTPAEFFDVFAAYNSRLWPAALALWVVSLLVVVIAFRAGEPRHRALDALLALHWAWSALAYHAAFFARITPAAWLFAALFLTQAAIFLWTGVIRGRLIFSTGRSFRHVLAAAVTAYALAYPLINLAEGRAFPRVPTFGLPCPTTILTAGILLTGVRPSWTVSLIPALWSMVGGSAALLLGVRSDLALFAAGALLLLRLGATRRQRVGAMSHDLRAAGHAPGSPGRAPADPTHATRRS